MTRQDQLKAELLGLLRRYNVKMMIEDNWINFYSPSRLYADYTEYTEHIDLYFVWENGKRS